MSDIDAAKDYTNKKIDYYINECRELYNDGYVVDGSSMDISLEMHKLILSGLEALTTLRDLKQELKENGDMPNTIWLQFDNDYPKHEQEITWCEDRHHSYDKQYTRTTPTLKKILGDL